MMRRRFVSYALALSLAPGLAVAQSKADGAKPAPSKPLPKASPRGESKPAELKQLPPFFGMFGTAEMIAKVGFRSKPGRFIEYKVDSAAGQPGDNQGMRLAEVGPEQPGGRWIEMTATDAILNGQGMRIFTRGEKNGNIERVIARISGMPPMEFPLESLGADGGAGLMSAGTSLSGPAKIVGRETITVPVGKFEADHWVVDVGPKRKMEFWLTSDEKIPFTGIVKMITENGTAVASKVGTDATAHIPVPPRVE